MSFNGSGVFSINSAGQPVVDGTTITATAFNTFTADIATGLSTAICKDGQTTVTANIPFGGYKLTGIGLGTATTDAARMDNANSFGTCEFRLSLTTGVPVTTSDVTAAETLYCVPYGGGRIALYTGTSWVMRTSVQMSIDVPDATNMYDVFCYDNAGTPTLELTAWTNETTRATALTTQDGVLVKTGVLTRKYLGSFYSTTAGNGQIEDSVANRYLWNYYNRVPRVMRALDTTDSYAYSLLIVREARGSTVNQLNFCVGVNEDMIEAEVYASVSSNNAAGTPVTAIGYDSTTAAATGCIFPLVGIGVANKAYVTRATLKTYSSVGKHYLAWLEAGDDVNTFTWYGDAGTPLYCQSGIHGTIMG